MNYSFCISVSYTGTSIKIMEKQLLIHKKQAMHLYIHSVLVPCFNLRCVRNQGFKLSLLCYSSSTVR